jgi:hypothetical protein
MSDSTNRERRNALLGLAACLQASSAWPQHSIETKKETNKTVKKTEFPDSPNEFWDRAKKLIDLSHPALEVQAIEEAFGFSFVDIDRELGKNDPEQAVRYTHKIATKSLGEIKISVLKTLKKIIWSIEWDRRSCELMMQHINLEAAQIDLKTLGWRAAIRNDFPSPTNRWTFHSVNIDEQSTDANNHNFSLMFPHQKSSCIIGFVAYIIGAK